VNRYVRCSGVALEHLPAASALTACVPCIERLTSSEYCKRERHNCLVLCLVLSAARQPLPRLVSQVSSWRYSWRLVTPVLLLRPPSSSRTMGYSSRLGIWGLHGEHERRCGSRSHACHACGCSYTDCGGWIGGAVVFLNDMHSFTHSKAMSTRDLNQYMYAST
jgi:hypothetical protein